MKASQLVVQLRALAGLEGSWYADVGRKTAAECCQAMREAADTIETLREVCDRLRDGHALWKEEWRTAAKGEADARKLLRELLDAYSIDGRDLEFGEATEIRRDAETRAREFLLNHAPAE